MNVWLEIISSNQEREGKYLICPIHSSTKKNYMIYRIMEDPAPDDIVFHYILGRVLNKSNEITSYSKIASRFTIEHEQDPLCSYPPPYRKIELKENIRLPKPITVEMLHSFKSELVDIARNSNLTRTPFDKNFRIKQLYLGRIPMQFLKYFSILSNAEFDVFPSC